MVVVLFLKVARAACSGLGRIGNDVATGAGAIAWGDFWVVFGVRAHLLGGAFLAWCVSVCASMDSIRVLRLITGHICGTRITSIPWILRRGFSTHSTWNCLLWRPLTWVCRVLRACLVMHLRRRRYSRGRQLVALWLRARDQLGLWAVLIWQLAACRQRLIVVHLTLDRASSRILNHILNQVAARVLWISCWLTWGWSRLFCRCAPTSCWNRLCWGTSDCLVFGDVAS